MAIYDNVSQEKTDYTYSDSISYRSQESARSRVGSPNMSRRGLKSSGYSKVSSSSGYSEYETDNLELRNRNVAKYGYSNQYGDDSSISTPSRTSRIRDTLFEEHNSSKITALEYGLDDSDSDLNMAGIPTRAEPIVRRKKSRQAYSNHVNSYNSQHNSYSKNKMVNGHSRSQSGVTYTAADEQSFYGIYLRTKRKMVSVFLYIWALLSTLFTYFARLMKPGGAKSFSSLFLYVWELLSTLFTYFTSLVKPGGAKSWSEYGRRLSQEQRSSVHHVNIIKRTTRHINYYRNIYNEKRRNNPVLWWWLPLFLLILSSGIAYYFLARSDREQAVEESVSEEYQSSSFNSIKQWSSITLSYLIRSCSFVFGFVSEFLSFVYTLFLSALHAIYNAVSYYFTSISSRINKVFGEAGNTARSVYRESEQVTHSVYSESVRYGKSAYSTAGVYMYNSFESFVSWGSLFFSSVWGFLCYSLSLIVHFIFSFMNYLSALFSPVKKNSEQMIVYREKETNEIFLSEKFHYNEIESKVLSDILKSEKLKEFISSEVSSTLDSSHIYKSQIYDVNKLRTDSDLHSTILIDLKKQLENVMDTISTLKTGKSHETTVLEENLMKVNVSLSSFEKHINELYNKVDELKSAKSCCDKNLVTLEELQHHFSTFLRNMKEPHSTDGEEFLSWLRGYFVAKTEAQSIVNSSFATYINENISLQRKSAVLEASDLVFQSVMKEIPVLLKKESKLRSSNKFSSDEYSNLNIVSTSILSKAEVEAIVSKMLKKYDADRTGMVDHALESAGGTIVSNRCTEDFNGHFEQYSIFGLAWPFFTPRATNTPRSIIQPARSPGNCWAFKSFAGYAVIHLAAPVRLTGFTMEHIPKSLSPKGSIDSAPRNFLVYGLEVYHDKVESDSVLLGNYTFLDNDEPLQYFEVQNHSDIYFPFVELIITSNHGHRNYTCVYRFRVHGVRHKDHV